MSFVIFIIGKPGSGKSEIRKAITQTVFNLDHNLKITSVDELDILYELKDKLPQEEIEETEDGHLIVNNRSLFSQTMQKFKQRLLVSMSSNDLLLCEFSRAKYSNILSEIISEIHQSYMIIYVDTPFSICIDRNEKRKSNNKYVPRSVMESYYNEDDLSVLRTQFKNNLQVVDNSNSQKEKLIKIVSKIVNSNVIPRFSDKYLYYKKSISWGEVIVAILLGTYLLLCLFLGYEFIFKNPTIKNVTYSFNLAYRIFGIAVAGGGIGSTLYCIRSFYSYYMDGLFNFKKLKWWYVFRPITGAIIAIALVALIKSQIIVLTNSEIQGDIDSYLTIFAISFLAGFSTEQVIERLRKASKALFGEEGDKGKKII